MHVMQQSCGCVCPSSVSPGPCFVANNLPRPNLPHFHLVTGGSRRTQMKVPFEDPSKYLGVGGPDNLASLQVCCVALLNRNLGVMVQRAGLTTPLLRPPQHHIVTACMSVSSSLTRYHGDTCLTRVVLEIQLIR